MEDQLVEFETANLAFEKGFECYTKSSYRNEELRAYSYQIGGLNKNTIPAPTQSLLQKWLREKHGIDIYIKRIGLISHEINVFRLGDSKSERKNRGSDWENILEWGLQEAIKLIK